MNGKAVNNAQLGETSNFDLFRLGKSKSVVDISVNTLRHYNKLGLRFYKLGKAIFVSKTELAAFIRMRAESDLLRQRKEVAEVSK
jgi:hypothetical protein